MDKIWDGNPSKSEIIGHCGGDEKPRMITRDRQKSNVKKKGFHPIVSPATIHLYIVHSNTVVR